MMFLESRREIARRGNSGFVSDGIRRINRGEVAIGVIALAALAVFVFGYITAEQSAKKADANRIAVVRR